MNFIDMISRREYFPKKFFPISRIDATKFRYDFHEFSFKNYFPRNILRIHVLSLFFYLQYNETRMLISRNKRNNF